MNKNFNAQKGQALVLVLLSLAVVLTLVLYILSRSVTDVLVSSKNEETARAFSAAEAGIEQSLVIGSSGAINGSFANNSSYSSNVTNFAEGSKAVNYPIELASGDSITLWFVSHDSTGSTTLCDATHPCFTGNTINICWGKSQTYSDASVIPAIEVSVFYETTPGSIPTTQIARVAIDPNSTRATSNNFGGQDAGICTIVDSTGSKTYGFQKSINLASIGIPLLAGGTTSENELQFARIRMLYNIDTTHPVGMNVDYAGGGVLPSQGSDAISTGTAGTSTRRIDVFQGWPEPPSVFDFAIYNSTGLTK